MRLMEGARARLRRNRRWVAFRRAQREGFVPYLRRCILWSQILRTAPVQTRSPEPEAAVEVHLLCWEADYISALWALKSFYAFAGVSFPLAIHFSGAINHRIETNLRTHFPEARLVTQPDATAAVEPELRSAGLNRLIGARRQNPFMLKLTDFLILGRAPRMIALDSDVLFFSKPFYLLSAAAAPRAQSLFMRDTADTYNISRERARQAYGIDLAPAVNTGIMVVDRDCIDLERCDYYLGDEEIARSTGFIEQTLYALAASERSVVEYLPPSYLVSLAGSVHLDTLVARHYAGPTRALMTSEGMRWLVTSGWLERMRMDHRRR